MPFRVKLNLEVCHDRVFISVSQETSCRYGTGRAPSSSKLLHDYTVHTLFMSIVGPLQLLSICYFVHRPYLRALLYTGKAKYETSNGPTMDWTGVWTVWIRKSSDGYSARLFRYFLLCMSNVMFTVHIYVCDSRLAMQAVIW